MNRCRRAGLFLSSLALALGLFLPRASASPTIHPLGTTIHQASRSYGGYTIFQNFSGGALMMINMNGRVVHQWRPQGLKTTYYAQPLPNRHLLLLAVRIAHRPMFIHGVIEMDWDGNVVWQYFHPDDLDAHHDCERLNNGNTLIMLNEQVSVPAISPISLKDDYLVEVNPAGTIVWEWRAAEHFEEFGFDAEARRLIRERGRDWLHSNSIQSLPATSLGARDSRFRPGNILVSLRETNTMFIINKQSGRIVWRTGPDNNLTIAQHAAEMIAPGLPGAGNILVFDNGGGCGYPPKYRYYSRVLEIDPATKRTVWEYSAITAHRGGWTFHSPYISGAQRLPNGNTLICEGDFGRLFEVTRDHETVWEYVNPYFLDDGGWRISANWIYRAVRVSPAWAGLD